MPDIPLAAAARFGLLLAAYRQGDRAVVAEQLVSIPEAELDAIEARLARFGVDLAGLLAAPAVTAATR